MTETIHLSEFDNVGVAVVAAGESSRMGGVDKMFASLGGAPLLAHCLKTFDESPSIYQIAIATSSGSLDDVKRLVEKFGLEKVGSVVVGGARRRDSVLNALSNLAGNRIALVHDGARPLVGQALIERALSAAIEFAAATTAVPVKDTIKVANPDLTVRETPNRNSLWAAQTPQAFAYDLVMEAHSRIEHDATDDAAMVEAIGHPVKLVMGSYDNIKITTPEDLLIAESILKSRQEDSSH